MRNMVWFIKSPQINTINFWKMDKNLIFVDILWKIIILTLSLFRHVKLPVRNYRCYTTLPPKARCPRICYILSIWNISHSIFLNYCLIFRHGLSFILYNLVASLIICLLCHRSRVQLELRFTFGKNMNMLHCLLKWCSLMIYSSLLSDL